MQQAMRTICLQLKIWVIGNKTRIFQKSDSGLRTAKNLTFTATKASGEIGRHATLRG